MLRVTTITNAAAAKQYFALGDYLIADQHFPAQWHGKGSALLGLSGDVDQNHFNDLCDNLRPGTNTPVTAKTIENRRVGYDFTFSLPKSASVLFALGADERIASEFQAAVAETMAEVEKEASTRVRKKKADFNRETGNLVWTQFLHTTSRPIDGQPDPQLHIHTVVFNMTHDPVEREWKAAQLGDVKASAPFFEAVFRSKMANRLQHLGYEIKKDRKDFEIVGVPPRVLDEFSRRTALIEKVAKKLKIEKAESKAKLGATTREKKVEGVPWESLTRKWAKRLKDDELASIHATAVRADSPIVAEDRTKEAVDFALDHLLERKSVVAERVVMLEALRKGLGESSLESIREELAGRDLVRREIGGKEMVSTREVLGEEQRIVAWAREGRGKCQSFGEDRTAAVRSSGATHPSFGGGMVNPTFHQPAHVPPGKLEHTATLSPSQSSAVQHVLTSRDRLILVRGAAGTGKTTMLHALTSQLSGPWGVFATQTSASRGVLRTDGFKDANTLAFLLKDKPTQDRLRGGLIVIDEASQTGARELARVVQLADQLNARILLLGDRRQHKSVARGDILGLLEKEAKLPVVEVSDIKRQAGQYKEAVKLLADGKTGAAFHKLDKLGWVKKDGLLDDYMAAVRKGESVLVVSPTNANAEVLTDHIRERLRQEGKLKGEERTFQRLVPLNLTEAERGNPEAIPVGTVAQFLRSGGGFKAGRRVEVSPDTVQSVANANGSSFALLRPERIRLANGDRIRTTATVKALDGSRLDNGTQLTVTGFSDKGIHTKTATGLTRILPPDVGHIAHAYVSTSHAAQGKTVQRVFVHMPAATLPAVTSETAYVSVSRGKLSATVYTDDRERLMQQWGREDNRLLAHDLLRRKRFAQRMREFTSRMVAAAFPRQPELTHERRTQHER